MYGSCAIRLCHIHVRAFLQEACTAARSHVRRPQHRCLRRQGSWSAGRHPRNPIPCVSDFHALSSPLQCAVTRLVETSYYLRSSPGECRTDPKYSAADCLSEILTGKGQMAASFSFPLAPPIRHEERHSGDAGWGSPCYCREHDRMIQQGPSPSLVFFSLSTRWAAIFTWY